MGKTRKWFKSLLTGKKDQKTSNVGVNHKHALADTHNPTTPMVMPMPNTPKEKRRWSFRRSSATAVGPKDPNPVEVTTVVGPKGPNPLEVATTPPPSKSEAESEDATVVAAQAVEEAIQLTSSSSGRCSVIEEVAAIKIQSVFRSYLARKALKALRGLVKLQAIVRGHLVRKQATTTLRCMQALAIAHARARAQRIRTVEDGMIMNHLQSTLRRNDQEKINHSNHSYHDMEENIKIVEMDNGEFRSNCKNRNSYSVSNQQQSSDKMDNRMSTYYSSQQRVYSKKDYQHISPAPSVITGMSQRNYSGYFDDYSFTTAQSSPQCYSTMSKPDQSSTMFTFPRPDYAETMSYDYPLYPNYMANTESSRAKVRSQSAPKQRPELERQPSRGRRASVEGRGIPRGARMQRSSSHVGSTAQNYHYPCSIKLDKSTVSLKDSECGSTCSVLTNANYSRSVVSYDPRYY